MQQKFIAEQIIQAGEAQGEVLKLDETVSFWGGINPRDGKIIDSRHPQYGVSIGNKILLLPSSRGSAGTPGGIAEAMRLGCAPIAILLLKPDVNIAIGMAVADTLYGTQTPLLSIDKQLFRLLENEMQVTIHDGEIVIL